MRSISAYDPPLNQGAKPSLIYRQLLSSQLCAPAYRRRARIRLTSVFLVFFDPSSGIVKSMYLATLTCAALLFTCAAAYSADEGKNDAQRETTTHRDFDSVDAHKHGYLTLGN
jgi:hypothetical protein